MIEYLARLLPCWLVGHDWSEWRHDNNYIASANMETRACSRQRWYSNRKHKWQGNTHFQRKWMGKIQ